MFEKLVMTWPDFIGLIGVAMILVAYAAMQVGKLLPHAPLYSLLNALGAALILFSLYFNFNAASFVIELAWLFISLLGLYRAFREQGVVSRPEQKEIDE